jgi:hypothetical protein
VGALFVLVAQLSTEVHLHNVEDMEEGENTGVAVSQDFGLEILRRAPDDCFEW